MSEGSRVQTFLDFIIDERYNDAKRACDEAAYELNALEMQFGSVLKPRQKEVIIEVEKIIKNINGGQTKAAKAAAMSTTPKFVQNIVGEYFKGGKMKSGGNSQQSKNGQGSFPKEGRGLKQQIGIHTQKDRQNTTSEGYGTYENNKQMPYETPNDKVERRVKGGNFDRSTRHQPETSDEYHKNQASKRASEALRINNADIADLSDTNRPTKIAERFSELYDNEWTEFFESLCKKKRLSEKEIIAELLRIVEEAYKFCKDEADRQIKELRWGFFKIITGEQHKTHVDDKGTELLVQYRKTIAQHALKRLQDQYTKQVIANVSDDKMVAYVHKAVELAWWMVVQDPPVYMCPSTPTNFDSNLYRAYTRSGKTPEYFVWPALKLYKDGGLLMKGVVQYRN